MAVWRKLSIRRCKSGENCTIQEIENKKQIPVHQNVTNVSLIDPGKEKDHVHNNIHMPILNTPLQDNELNGKELVTPFTHINARSTNITINSSGSDLVVGSLNLVCIPRIYFT